MNYSSVKEIHMNCEWEIKAFPQTLFSESQTLELIKQAFAIVADIEAEFTYFKQSPLTSINENAGKKPTKVSKRLLQVIQRAIEFSKRTKTLFDITYPTKNKRYQNSSLIEINDHDSTIYLPFEEMVISLGGIGKGFAVDAAFDFLKSKGLINFMINGSGDLRCHSHPNAPRAWNLGISNPFNPSKTIGLVKFKNNAMATSGIYKKGQHIRTEEIGTPISVTIFGDSTEQCDIWGTYLCSLSCEEAIKLMNTEGLMGLIVDSSGNCYSSKKTLKSQEKFKEQYHA